MLVPTQSGIPAGGPVAPRRASLLGQDAYDWGLPPVLGEGGTAMRPGRVFSPAGAPPRRAMRVTPSAPLRACRAKAAGGE